MQRVYLGLIMVLFTGILQAQEIEWMTMNEALEAQKKEPKKIFMDAYTTWCGPCKLLDRNTFSNSDVATYINKHFYPVKFNAEGTEEITYRNQKFTNPTYVPDKKGRNSTHQFARTMRITGYPSLVFFDEKGGIIGPIPGYRSPQQIEVLLKLFKGEDYKKVTTPEAWREYESSFEYEFQK